jgi:hypothetical protein
MMSLDLYLVLSGALPSLTKLNERFEQEGGASGSWKTGAQIGAVELTLAEDARELVSALLKKTGKKLAVDHVLRLTEGEFEDAEDVAEVLLKLCGGALMSESGAVLLSHSGPKKKPALAEAVAAKAVAAQPKRRGSLDTSIPPEVLELLGGEQALYEVHPRQDPTTSSRTLMKAVPQPTPEVEYGPSSERSIKLGPLWFARARVVYRTAFEPWYVKECTPEEWLSTLHYACGFARNTRAVLLRRIEGGDVRYDFDPSAPLPPTVPLAVGPCENFSATTLQLLARGSGPMIGMGQKIAIRWHIPGATEPVETRVVLGAAKTNPALAHLHGEQPGTTVRIAITEPRGLTSRVPPCPDGPSAVLEITILKLFA